MKRVLITGAGSYIGECFADYLRANADYAVESIGTIDGEWERADFSGYDVVFHVAGIAHIKETKENEHLYYDVNRDLTLKIAEKSKAQGVGQFIVLSSMSVYGKETGYITKSTEPAPCTAYGKSKYEADLGLAGMETPTFTVAILRPPMVYGKGCKGNYNQLRKLALKSPVFPLYKNERSMVYVGNLCEFVKCVIDEGKRGVFFPQNSEYVNTSELAKCIVKIHGKKRFFLPVFRFVFACLPIRVIKKAFGNLTYEKVDTVDKFSFEESIKLTEE